jgi:hypothetical protein
MLVEIALSHNTPHHSPWPPHPPHSPMKIRSHDAFRAIETFARHVQGK